MMFDVYQLWVQFLFVFVVTCWYCVELSFGSKYETYARQKVQRMTFNVTKIQLRKGKKLSEKFLWICKQREAMTFKNAQWFSQFYTNCDLFQILWTKYFLRFHVSIQRRKRFCQQYRTKVYYYATGFSGKYRNEIGNLEGKWLIF